MKKWPVITGAAISLSIVLFFVFIGNPVLAWNSHALSQAVKNTTETSVTLNDITPFEWDTVYSFEPYVSKENIEKVIGFKDNNIRETVNEGMVHLIFLKDNKLVCSIRGYSDNLGYTVLFETGEDGYTEISYEDNSVFTVRRDGGIVELIVSPR